jgi:hypothetical protein
LEAFGEWKNREPRSQTSRPAKTIRTSGDGTGAGGQFNLNVYS